MKEIESWNKFCMKWNIKGDKGDFTILALEKAHKFGFQDGVKETQEQIIKEIKNLRNPYPKDIFVWDNKKKCEFNRGRFNQHCFEIWENCKEDMIKRFYVVEIV